MKWNLFLLLTLTFFSLMIVSSLKAQQVFLYAVPPEDQFGDVTLNKHATSDIGPVVFQHWLHRAKFTCRACHVDLGFAMQGNGTGVDAKSNRDGYHCGACHDGKRQVGGVVLFKACVPGRVANTNDECSRCHSSSRTKHKYSYKEFTSRFPKSKYGVDWMAAEKSEVVKPVDVVEGISIQKQRMKNRPDMAFRPYMEHFSGIRFSHELHSKWNGCELCHPEIFPTEKNNPAAGITMYQIAQGRFCGACHLKVAFPVNGCNKCHTRGPDWIDGPRWLM